MKQTFEEMVKSYKKENGFYDSDALYDAAVKYFEEHPCVHSIDTMEWENMEGCTMAVAYVLPYEESKMHLLLYSCEF